MNNFVKNWPRKKALIQQLLEEPLTYAHHQLTHIVEEILSKRERFLAISSAQYPPCYAFDRENLTRSATRFQNAFTNHLPNTKSFYAVKVNHFDPLLRHLFSHDFGADVSSARELAFALRAGAQQILFSGPGKTIDELKQAVGYHQKVLINIDSFGELQKLRQILSDFHTQIRAGVRISIHDQGEWGKFGIPLEQLNDFFTEAATIPMLTICGIQCHMSWNRDASPYQVAIEQIARYLKESLRPGFRNQISFIDIGGGFRPYNSEGFYPEDTPLGQLIQGACDRFDEPADFTVPYCITEAVPIEEYAQGIAAAIKTHLHPLGNFEYYVEPGRIICNDAMHVVVQVEDVKSPTCVITNGGTNIVGFERFEFDYFPLINVSNPSTTEIPCTVYGSLCMPQDYWGHRIYASKMEVGDCIVIPYQGALTYANMQGFIKGEVPVFEL